MHLRSITYCTLHTLLITTTNVSHWPPCTQFKLNCSVHVILKQLRLVCVVVIAIILLSLYRHIRSIAYYTHIVDNHPQGMSRFFLMYLAKSAWVMACVHPLPSRKYPRVVKAAISMYKPPRRMTNISSPYTSGQCHWICLAIVNNDWSSVVQD